MKPTKKVPPAPFENPSYGLTQLAKAINENMAQNTKVSAELLAHLKKQDAKKTEIKVTVPEIKIPEIKVPQAKMPTINIPEQKPANVFVPEVKIPEVKVTVPEVKQTVGWDHDIIRDSRGLLKKVTSKRIL